MLGPVFNREAIVAPKRTKTYLARAIYVLSLFVLLSTGYLVLAGTRPLSGASDLSRFGSSLFALLAPLQLVVLASLSAVGAASNVAQEKDRRTLLLLLMTRLSGSEIVLGKWAASLLTPLSMLLAALPLFLAFPLFGGVSMQQVVMAYSVTLVSVLLAAAVGTVVGLWREKSFQAIATTVLLLLIYLVAAELIRAGWAGGLMAQLASWISPLAAISASLTPFPPLTSSGLPVTVAFTLTTAAIVALVLVFGVGKVRDWNPSKEIRFKPSEPESDAEFEEQLAAARSASKTGSAGETGVASVPGSASETGAAGETGVAGGQRAAVTNWKAREPRPVWDNPVLWREICTWAYGRKVVLVRLAFLALFAVAAAVIVSSVRSGEALRRFDAAQQTLPVATLPVAAIVVISLVLVNALAVNSITGERDGLALDLLLVTDIRPAEFIFGKLGGVFYVAKEMILLPLSLIVYLGWSGAMTWENTAFALLGALQLYFFAAVLGVHSGLNYVAGRTATLVSLGTVFFLCVGVAILMVIMVSFRGAFQLQLAPFLAMILGGGAALFAALGWRNPSSAIFAASFLLPLITFYAITQFLLQRDQLFVVVTVLTGYGFTTAAMLIPAVSEFDVALDRDGGGD